MHSPKPESGVLAQLHNEAMQLRVNFTSEKIPPVGEDNIGPSWPHSGNLLASLIPPLLSIGIFNLSLLPTTEVNLNVIRDRRWEVGEAKTLL